MVAVTTSSPISSDLSEANTKDILNYIDNYEDDPSEFLEGVRVSEIAVPFKEVTCIEKFKVIIDGLNINSEIPKPILKKYYELCRSQISYLHQNLVERLNCKLVVGLISETVNIADAIKACKITTAESDFLTWDKTLQASEILGMNVSFLRTRLTELASLASEAQRYKDSRLEREQREAEYRAMLANYLEVKDEADREESKKLVKLDVSFKEVTKAPW